jgi:calcineurin-like phosphoesterase family protein
VKPKEGCALGEGFLLEPQGMESPTVSHLVIQGNWDAFQSDCGDRDPYRRVTVRGHKALLIECPDTAGLHAGHVLLRWVEEGTFVIVSVHGHTVANRQFVQRVAASIEIVGPR